MARSISILLFLFAIPVLLIGIYRPLFTASSDADGGGFNLAELVASADSEDFEPVGHPYRFAFPADHGRHPEARTETWQLSGLLADAAGRRFGIQLSIARIGLAKPGAGWDSGEIYAGQLLLSDPGGDRLLAEERVSRGGIGVADWRAQPLRLWLEDWSIEQRGSEARAPDLDLRVALAELEIDLMLQNRQPLVSLEDITDPNTDNSLPFVYYLLPRLAANGRLYREGRVVEVTGNLSIEHAWGELPLPGGPLARDRFSLYFEDGRVLLLVRSHRVDGSGQPATVGLLTDAEGSPVVLDDDEIDLRPVDYWTSEISGASYPVGWRLRLPGEAIEIGLTAERRDRETTGGSESWAGAIRVESDRAGLSGHGYMQLAGYRR